MVKRKMLAANISSRSIIFMLLALTVPITANQLPTESGFFQKLVKGKRLSDCLISEKIVSDLIECGQWCLSHNCQSLNYGEDEESEGLYTCELNNCTKKDRLMLMAHKKFDYYEMIKEVSQHERCSEPSLSVLFPRLSTKDYMVIDDKELPELSAFSICAWVKFGTERKNGTTLSYAVTGSTNEINIYHEIGQVELIMNGPTICMKNSSISDDFWHAMCVTWSNIDGKLTVYKDNAMSDQAPDVRTGQNITGGGLWVLGQDQDSVGGGFVIQDSFQGEMAEMNVWGRVLTKQEIARFSTDCQRRMNGDVKSWPEFTTSTRLRGDVRVVDEPSCAKSLE